MADTRRDPLTSVAAEKCREWKIEVRRLREEARSHRHAANQAAATIPVDRRELEKLKASLRAAEAAKRTLGAIDRAPDAAARPKRPNIGLDLFAGMTQTAIDDEIAHLKRDIDQKQNTINNSGSVIKNYKQMALENEAIILRMRELFPECLL